MASFYEYSRLLIADLYCAVWGMMLYCTVWHTGMYTCSCHFRTYHHFKTLGLFLFNDSLVVTRRTSRHLPFERSVEHTYHFETCASLTRLRVRDIPDSKCEFMSSLMFLLPTDSNEVNSLLEIHTSIDKMFYVHNIYCFTNKY